MRSKCSDSSVASMPMSLDRLSLSPKIWLAVDRECLESFGVESGSSYLGFSMCIFCLFQKHELYRDLAIHRFGSLLRTVNSSHSPIQCTRNSVASRVQYFTFYLFIFLFRQLFEWFRMIRTNSRSLSAKCAHANRNNVASLVHLELLIFHRAHEPTSTQMPDAINNFICVPVQPTSTSPA